jgi:hypothetical protein
MGRCFLLTFPFIEQITLLLFLDSRLDFDGAISGNFGSPALADGSPCPASQN